MLTKQRVHEIPMPSLAYAWWIPPSQLVVEIAKNSLLLNCPPSLFAPCHHIQNWI
jgi:hypothetical protein